MSRFNSLEFGDQFDDQLPRQKELVKGEAFYMARSALIVEPGDVFGAGFTLPARFADL